MAAYLIDYENVKSEGIRGILQLSENDSVIIFYSHNADTLTFETMDMIFNSKATVRKYKLLRGGKNALDFQLSTYLGYLIHEGKDSSFYIISKDNGYQHVVEFWKRTFNYEGYVYCFPTIADGYARQRRFDTATAKERAKSIEEDLLAIQNLPIEETEDCPASIPETAVFEDTILETADSHICIADSDDTASVSVVIASVTPSVQQTNAEFISDSAIHNIASEFETTTANTSFVSQNLPSKSTSEQSINTASAQKSAEINEFNEFAEKTQEPAISAPDIIPHLPESQPEIIDEPDITFKEESDIVSENKPNIISEKEPDVVFDNEPNIISEKEFNVVSEKEFNVVSEKEPDIVSEIVDGFITETVHKDVFITEPVTAVTDKLADASSFEPNEQEETIAFRNSTAEKIAAAVPDVGPKVTVVEGNITIHHVKSDSATTPTQKPCLNNSVEQQTVLNETLINEVPVEISAKEISSKEASSNKTAAKKAAAKDTISAKEESINENSVKKAAAKKTTIKKTTVKKATAKKAAAESSIKESTPNEVPLLEKKQSASSSEELKTADEKTNIKKETKEKAAPKVSRRKKTASAVQSAAAATTDTQPVTEQSANQAPAQQRTKATGQRGRRPKTQKSIASAFTD